MLEATTGIVSSGHFSMDDRVRKSFCIYQKFQNVEKIKEIYTKGLDLLLDALNYDFNTNESNGKLGNAINYFRENVQFTNDDNLQILANNIPYWQGLDKNMAVKTLTCMKSKIITGPAQQ